MFNEINNKFIGKNMNFISYISNLAMPLIIIIIIIWGIKEKIYKTTQVMIVYNSLCKLKS